MGNLQAQVNKLKQAKTFPWKELVNILLRLGYEMHERAGSRVVFQDQSETSNRIHLHKPHPENYLKGGALKAVKSHLSQKGQL